MRLGLIVWASHKTVPQLAAPPFGSREARSAFCIEGAAHLHPWPAAWRISTARACVAGTEANGGTFIVCNGLGTCVQGPYVGPHGGKCRVAN